MDEQPKKRWYTYKMEYYSAMRKKEILPFAATWMDLEGITLSEMSQRETNTGCQQWGQKVQTPSYKMT